MSPSDLPSFEIHELFELISRVKVKTVMTENPVTIPYDYTVEEAAELLLVHNISGVPVVDQVKKPVGVITKTDLFRVLFSLTGISKKGIQFAFQLIDRPGAIRDVTDILRDYGGRIASVLSTRGQAEKGFPKVYIHAYGFDPEDRQRIKEVIKDKAPPLYIVDHETHLQLTKTGQHRFFFVILPNFSRPPAPGRLRRKARGWDSRSSKKLWITSKAVLA